MSVTGGGCESAGSALVLLSFDFDAI